MIEYEVDTLRSFSEGGLPYCFGAAPAKVLYGGQGFRPARPMAGGRTIATTDLARGAPFVKLQLFMRFDDYLYRFSGISNKLKAGASICQS